MACNFSAEVSLSERITETQKTRLMVAVADAIKNVVGDADRGAVLIITPRTPDSEPDPSNGDGLFSGGGTDPGGGMFSRD